MRKNNFLYLRKKMDVGLERAGGKRNTIRFNLPPGFEEAHGRYYILGINNIPFERIFPSGEKNTRSIIYFMHEKIYSLLYDENRLIDQLSQEDVLIWSPEGRRSVPMRPFLERFFQSTSSCVGIHPNQRQKRLTIPASVVGEVGIIRDNFIKMRIQGNSIVVGEGRVPYVFSGVPYSESGSFPADELVLYNPYQEVLDKMVEFLDSYLSGELGG